MHLKTSLVVWPYQFENMVRGPYLPKNFQIQKIMIVWGQKVNFGLRVEMAAVAWLSVIAKRGVHVVVPFKVIRCCWDDTFAELLSKAAPEITIWSKSELTPIFSWLP